MNLLLNILSGSVVGFIVFSLLYVVGRAFITEVFDVNNDRKLINVALSIGAGILLCVIVGGITFVVASSFIRVFLLFLP